MFCTVLNQQSESDAQSVSICFKFLQHRSVFGTFFGLTPDVFFCQPSIENLVVRNAYSAKLVSTVYCRVFYTLYVVKPKLIDCFLFSTLV